MRSQRRKVELLVLLATLLFAQIQAADESPVGEAKTFSLPEKPAEILQYRYVAPSKFEPGKKYPLMVCLHGAGERGSDNQRQLSNFSVLLNSKTREQFPCFMIMPQVADGVWATFGWGTKSKTMEEKPTKALALTKALVDKVLAKEPIDPNRIYITGLSMGGFGAWEFVQRWPEIAAAALPISGGGDPAQAEKLLKLPIWAFHSEKDGVVPSEGTVKMVEALKSKGGTPKCKIFASSEHCIWDTVYRDPAVLPWLFAQRRGQAAVEQTAGAANGK